MFRFVFLLGISFFSLSYSYRLMDIHDDFPTCPANNKEIEKIKPIDKHENLYNDINSKVEHKTQQNENKPSNWLMQIIKIITIPMETHQGFGKHHEEGINRLPKRDRHISQLQPKSEDVYQQTQTERTPKIVLLIKERPHDEELRVKKRNPYLYHFM
ncbi:uncharacterized protein LOC121404774 [Drosophila obscura]|uniref:uncharacterized protein LOC121404774 n=1 Tax=Drosophila obscura TaxID=7282 RepID=UPI001BB1A8EB|nr:uncharacterized protein LOC121404774 [Drosophila obscura]